MGIRSKIAKALYAYFCVPRGPTSQNRSTRFKRRSPSELGHWKLKGKSLDKHDLWFGQERSASTRGHYRHGRQTKSPGEDLRLPSQAKVPQQRQGLGKIDLGFEENAQTWGKTTTDALIYRSSDQDQSRVMVPAPLRQTSTRRRELVTPEPSAEPWAHETVGEVLDTIGRIFAHGTPYCISGQAALAYYDTEESLSPPDHVSLLCPHYARHNVRCWAIAHGMQAIRTSPGSFAVPTSDGKLRRVRVKFLDNEVYHRIETIQAGTFGTNIMTLPSLSNLIARCYTKELKTRGPSLSRQDAYAREMRWVLRYMARQQDERHRLLPHRATEILVPDFWIPFSLAYPDTVPLFARAGLVVSGEPHVREHGMLIEYSLPTDWNLETLTTIRP